MRDGVGETEVFGTVPLFIQADPGRTAVRAIPIPWETKVAPRAKESGLS